VAKRTEVKHKTTSYNYTVSKKTFYFCNNFIKMFHIKIDIGSHIGYFNLQRNDIEIINLR